METQTYNFPVAKPFTFDHHFDFHAADSDALLRSVPAAPGVFALRGEAGEPYLSHTADLRRRMRRLLAPPEAVDADGNPILSRRLNLRDRVRTIAYTRTGSAFESTLVLYNATRSAFGAEEARRRLRLHTPYFVRVTRTHEHPRVYVTNRLSNRSFDESFGPFPSRAAAERTCDAVLDLFLLRRCYEDLQPYPEHPGCVYGEMKKCMEPCKQACTPEQYAQETQRVFNFFQTRGQSMLDEVATQREAASEAMDFEAAAALHKQWEKIRAVSLLADELVRPLAALRAVIVQEAAPHDRNDAGAPHDPSTTPGGPLIAESRPAMSGVATAAQGSDAAVFLLDHGHLLGPARLSTLGVRAVREQTAVGSSLFAQPLMLSAIPLDEPAANTVILSEAQRSEAQSKDPEAHSPTDTTQALSTTASVLAPTTNLSSRPESAAPPTNLSSRPESAAPPTNLSSRPESAALADVAERPAALPAAATSLSPEDRARQLLTQLESETQTPANLDELCDALSLFRRWYYRPEKQRTGEVFLPNPDGGWPIRRILNGAARVVLGPPAPSDPVEREKAREAAKALKTKILHPGREGVEREVPVLPKRPRTRKAVTPTDLTS